MSGPEPDPLDRFFREAVRRAGGLFGNQPERISEQEALYCLGALIENGKEQWLEILREQNVPFPDPEGAIADLFACINEDSLFVDPSFAFSLRLALCNVTVVAIKEKKSPRELFSYRIDEIFPEGLRERIHRHVFGSILKDHDDGKSIVPSREEIERHFSERRRAMRPSTAYAPIRSVRNPGTDTWMEPCPDCGVEKRCDKRTKRFRCKPCGFDQPYPFGSNPLHD